MSAILKIKTLPASAQAQPAPDRMPVFSTASALAVLWQKANGSMTPHELEWMADGAAQQVSHDARTLAAVVEGTACLVSSDEGNTGAFADSDSTSTLLFNLHSQLSTLAGLAEISAQANSLARPALKGGKA